ncbi:LysR family transcriptional regulator ArgP [Pseudophaeobacter flagellatus]|uniref:LysR family transcriptional regulator ArgP n=1 Tax=Pseudophaeobacter flagellatus TaxID=2899119 RepID=UPI001E426662|nr:LysR family transcriptional regulator ArgP [Pseudophaeobacter flagellatus]MCD9148892.1 LysR family transcriptional regulator ArgP [Pseudophaeobacter flagellatus]
MQFDPNHLSALAAVIRLGSFDSAAQSLGLTPSAVSQRIKALEERVGGALIKRGLPCTGTKAGQRLAKHAEDVAVLEGQVSRALALDPSPEAPPLLRIAVNADSLATWFIAAMVATPDLLFDLVIDDQDHSADWLKRGEVSAAITAHAQPVPGCNAQPLGVMRYQAMASPAYMAKWFAGRPTAQALAQAPCLTYNPKDTLQQRWIQLYFGKTITPPAHFIPSAQGFADAALAGLGWGMIPVAQMAPALKSGALVPLLPDSAMDVALNWQVSRVMASALAPLTRAVLSSARHHLPPPPS